MTGADCHTIAEAIWADRLQHTTATQTETVVLTSDQHGRGTIWHCGNRPAADVIDQHVTINPDTRWLIIAGSGPTETGRLVRAVMVVDRAGNVVGMAAPDGKAPRVRSWATGETYAAAVARLNAAEIVRGATRLLEGTR